MQSRSTRRRGVRRARRRYRPSVHIQRIEDLAPGTPVFLWSRVSSQRQDGQGALDDLTARASAAELLVVGETNLIAPANSERALTSLMRAGAEAQRLGAVILALCTSRYARAESHHAANAPRRRAGRSAVEGACWLAGVPLVTVLDPDLDPAEEKGELGKLRQRSKGKPGGRPPTSPAGYKKERRRELRPHALRLHADGLAKRAIGRELGVPDTTVRRWLK